ncbi:MAG: hypothetical protein ACK58T_31965, partial [Phycisphaerae bacterium]
AERRDIFERYIGEIAKACGEITGEDAKPLYEALLKQARKRTAVADLKLDEEGRKLEDPADQEGVIVVEQAANLANLASPALAAAKAAAEVDARVKKLEDDEQPRLLKDSSDKKAAKPKGASSPAKAGKDQKSSKQVETVPAKKASTSKNERSPAAKPAKPKMRLNPKTGKLERVVEPGLF